MPVDVKILVNCLVAVCGREDGDGMRMSLVWSSASPSHGEPRIKTGAGGGVVSTI